MKRLIFLFLFLAAILQAQSLTIACAKGYKKPLTELIREFEKQQGITVEPFYGNMGQVFSQARLSGKVSLIIGDRDFLEKSGLETDGYFDIGQGKLVLAYPKSGSLTALSDLTKPAIKRIALPDPQKAIFGKAANASLDAVGMREKLHPKLLVVATVPQVSAYLVTGEIDAGFINLTDALAIRQKIGGYFEVDAALYKPIVIVAARLKNAPQNEEAKAFAAFIRTQKAQAVLKQYGL
jgi:molybdate transport system substrate-binding protein